MNWLGERVVQVVRFVVAMIFIFATLLNLANVIGRYVFLAPIVWAEEVILYTLIWSAMVSMPVVTAYGTHLKMEVLFELVPLWAKRVIMVLINLVSAAVSLYVTYLAVQVIQTMQAVGQHSLAAGIPLAFAYLSLPVGFGLNIGALILSFHDLLRGSTGRPLGQTAPTEMTLEMLEHL
ncbi:MAG: TRAP transporter small permease [Deltaproteobacteria bacterium]|nr:TRAP transporter small permease [Deltaproteobacteria bacterium]